MMNYLEYGKLLNKYEFITPIWNHVAKMIDDNKITPKIKTPAIVGVPCFAKWLCGPLSRIGCPVFCNTCIY